MGYVITIIIILALIVLIKSIGADYEESYRIYTQTHTLRDLNIRKDIVESIHTDTYLFLVDKPQKVVIFKQGDQNLEIPFKNIIHATLSQAPNEVPQ